MSGEVVANVILGRYKLTKEWQVGCLPAYFPFGRLYGKGKGEKLLLFCS